MDSNELKKREAKKKKLESELKVAEKNSLRQKKKFCDDRKQEMLSLDKNTTKMITGSKQIKPGAPTKIDNMGLTSGIAKIAITGSAAHECQCSEVIQTIGQLTAAFRSEGCNLRRSSVYLRLIPRNVCSIDRKRHVNAAPMKLLCWENSKRSSHVGCQVSWS